MNYAYCLSCLAYGNQTCIPDFTHAECNKIKKLLMRWFCTDVFELLVQILRINGLEHNKKSFQGQNVEQYVLDVGDCIST